MSGWSRKEGRRCTQCAIGSQATQGEGRSKGRQQARGGIRGQVTKEVARGRGRRAGEESKGRGMKTGQANRRDTDAEGPAWSHGAGRASQGCARTCDGKGGDDLWRCHKRMRRGVAVIARRKVPAPPRGSRQGSTVAWLGAGTLLLLAERTDRQHRLSTSASIYVALGKQGSSSPLFPHPHLPPCLLKDVMMELGCPLATSVRFHCPMQGPHELDSTVPPI